MSETKQVIQVSLEESLSGLSEGARAFLRLRTHIASQLREYLRASDMTQRTLAQKTNLKPSYVSRVLSGSVNLTLETIAKFQVAFGKEIVVVPKVQAARMRKAENKMDALVHQATQIIQSSQIVKAVSENEKPKTQEAEENRYSYGIAA
jgi:transcriptional regulator with XRE-family HTH domain